MKPIISMTDALQTRWRLTSQPSEKLSCKDVKNAGSAYKFKLTIYSPKLQIDRIENPALMSRPKLQGLHGTNH